MPSAVQGTGAGAGLGGHTERGREAAHQQEACGGRAEVGKAQGDTWAVSGASEIPASRISTFQPSCPFVVLAERSARVFPHWLVPSLGVAPEAGLTQTSDSKSAEGQKPRPWHLSPGCHKTTNLVTTYTVAALVPVGHRPVAAWVAHAPLWWSPAHSLLICCLLGASLGGLLGLGG